MRLGLLQVFNSINIVPCGQGKAKFLKQEPRTWSRTRELWLCAFKMPMDETGNFFVPINIVTLTFVNLLKESTSNISSNISEIHTSIIEIVTYWI